MSEELKRSKKPSKMKEIMKKRWFAPTIYITSAALLLTGALWYTGVLTEDKQEEFDYTSTDVPSKGEEPAVEVIQQDETLSMPAKNADQLVVKRPFYEVTADGVDQTDALVNYNGAFDENWGVSLGLDSNESFEVVAALSGTVTVAELNDVVGNTIVIQHSNDVTTVYQAVSDFTVEVGDQVEQGQVIAKSGQSEVDKVIGNHVYFELQVNGEKVSPMKSFHKPVSALFSDAEETVTEE